MKYFEISTKTGEGINFLLEDIKKSLIEKFTLINDNYRYQISKYYNY